MTQSNVKRKKQTSEHKFQPNPQRTPFGEELPYLRTYLRLQHLADRLPRRILELIIGAALTRNYNDQGFETSLRGAVDFQSQKSWRCAACYKWHDEVNLPVGALLPGRIMFVSVCKKCEARYKTDERITKAIEPYVTAEEEQR